MANEMENLRLKIDKLKAERDKRIGMIEQAENEIRTIKTELEAKGFDEETLNAKIDALQEREKKLKSIIAKRITECEKLIEGKDGNN